MQVATDTRKLVDALGHVFEVLGRLRQLGIKMCLVPSKSRYGKTGIPRQSTANQLPSAWWFHVTLLVPHKEAREAVSNALESLAGKGIKFDTGGTVGERDWELDWSFELLDSANPKLRAWKERRGVVEGLIEDLHDPKQD